MVGLEASFVKSNVSPARLNPGVGPDTTNQLPDEEYLTSSALALSTPLHAAIVTFNNLMLQALLDRGSSPNARALITGSCALTPLQYAIDLGSTEAYSVLDAHNQLDKTILTPIFNVHILHFATAHLHTYTMQMIGLPLSAAPPKALGHTLLHVAYLPHTFHEV
jgi:ankyrin repeat protein